MRLFNTGNNIGMIAGEWINIDDISMIQQSDKEYIDHDYEAYNVYLGSNDHYVSLSEEKMIELRKVIDE